MKRILVVEDEYGIAEALKLLLELRGYRIELASNGREGLSAARKDPPDLVITDYMMPISTGAELGRALRSSPELRSVPIIITSSAEESQLRETFDRYDRYLRKPYTSRQMLALVEALI